jgi:hypothetical protein
MDQAALRTAVRSLIKEDQTETGALFPADNILIDFYLALGLNAVTLDIMHFAPDLYYKTELVSLTANTPDVTLTNEPVRIYAFMKNVAGSRPKSLRYLQPGQQTIMMDTGETIAEPENWTLSGKKTITFFATPSAAKTSYAKMYMSVNDVMLTTGPTYLPEALHYMLALKAASFVGVMNGTGDQVAYDNAYQKMMSQARLLYGARIQGQPKFVLESSEAMRLYDSRDPAFFDVHGFFND